MISKHCFSKEWIMRTVHSNKRGRVLPSPPLMQKVIRALSLLEALAISDLDFIFKGGTALILMLNKIHRFSTDIDIIVEEREKDIQSVFNQIIQKGYFKRFEEIQRKSNKEIPKTHFKFFYDSCLDEQEEYILLDILFEEVPYEQIIEKNVQCDFLQTDGVDAKVKMPSINCILGDKLTAFAPNTTGIRYGVDKELEIIKQLFDISNLFDEADDLEVTKNTFIKISNKENDYRNLVNYSYINVLDDIFDTSLILAYRGSKDTLMFKELEKGVQKIKGYILSENFIMERAILCASKAAYLSLLLRSKNEKIERFSQSIKIEKLRVDSKIINSIKKFSEEGFFYWYQALCLYKKLEEDVAISKE